MMKSLVCAFAIVLAMALVPPTPAQAQAQAPQAITTQDGLCYGVANDGRSIVTRRCASRFNVAIDGNQLVAFLEDGTQGCIDGYQGKGNSAEVVGCDWTDDQKWYVHPSGQLQNVKSGLCLDIEGASHDNGARIVNWDCNASSWNQLFAFRERGGVASSAGITGSPAPPAASAGSFGSPAPSAEILSHNGGTLVGNDGSTLVGNDGASVVPTGGGSMQSQSTDGGHGGIIAAGAGNLVGLDSTTLVAAGAGNATGGYSLQSVNGMQLKIGSLCLDAAGSTAVVKDCGSATSFQVSGSRLQVMGTNRCVDGWRGQYKVGREEDQNAREAVTVENCDGSQEQTWNAAYVNESAQFFVMNTRYPLCMDVDGGVVASGRALLLWKCYDSARPQNQIFALASPAAPSYTAPVAAPAPVYAAPAAAPAPVYAAPAATATYRIAVGALCLNGTSPVTVTDCGAATRFEMAGGTLKITGTNSCVDGWRGQYKVGHEEDQAVREPVRVENCDGSGEQNWAQYLQVGGGFFLKDSHYGLCMDVDGGVIAAGREVLLWKCYDGVRPQNQIYAVMN